MRSVAQEPFREETVSFEGPAGTLAGTLAIPSASRSRGSVVILAGSGRNDRDGNGRRLSTGIYRDLARILIRQRHMNEEE